jgi:hypothetical protein
MRLILGRLRRDDGNVLISVILVSMLVTALASATLTTGEQADRSSTRDRNSTIALGVAEAGVHEVINRIETLQRTGYVASIPAFTGATENGSYTASATRSGSNFIVTSQGAVGGGGQFERKRRVQVTLAPPELFPNAGYALFSATSLYIKNNGEVFDGDIWSNDSLWVENGAIIQGNITSAQSWVKLETGVRVTGSVWAGGRFCEAFSGSTCTAGFAIDQSGPANAGGALIGGFAKASVSAPDCASVDAANYDIRSSGVINGAKTAPPGATGPSGTQFACTFAPPRKETPSFVFNANHYDPTTLRTFASAADFNTAFTAPGGADGVDRDALRGTYVIKDCANNTVNLMGGKIDGDVTIITNPGTCENGVVTGAKVRVEDITETASVTPSSRAKFVVMSHHVAPPGAICTDQNDTACAISAKNKFNQDCRVATMLYADNGPVSIKNDTDHEDTCGTVIASGIHMKNNLQMRYDPIFDSMFGFCPPEACPSLIEITRWRELPVT